MGGYPTTELLENPTISCLAINNLFIDFLHAMYRTIQPENSTLYLPLYYKNWNIVKMIV